MLGLPCGLPREVYATLPLFHAEKLQLEQRGVFFGRGFDHSSATQTWRSVLSVFCLGSDSDHSSW